MKATTAATMKRRMTLMIPRVARKTTTMMWRRSHRRTSFPERRQGKITTRRGRRRKEVMEMTAIAMTTTMLTGRRKKTRRNREPSALCSQLVVLRMKTTRLTLNQVKNLMKMMLMKTTIKDTTGEKMQPCQSGKDQVGMMIQMAKRMTMTMRGRRSDRDCFFSTFRNCLPNAPPWGMPLLNAWAWMVMDFKLRRICLLNILRVCKALYKIKIFHMKVISGWSVLQKGCSFS